MSHLSGLENFDTTQLKKTTTEEKLRLPNAEGLLKSLCFCFLEKQINLKIRICLNVILQFIARMLNTRSI